MVLNRAEFLDIVLLIALVALLEAGSYKGIPIGKGANQGGEDGAEDHTDLGPGREAAKPRAGIVADDDWIGSATFHNICR